MRKNLEKHGGRCDRYDQYYFDREKKLPGPGSYAETQTVGTKMTASTMITSRQSSIPKAQDRFMSPTIHKQLPSPNQYTP